MNPVASMIALLCLALFCIVSASAATCEDPEVPCGLFCSKNDTTCPAFNCGKSKTCVQVCSSRDCGPMTCASDSCIQKCETDCQRKMVCSGDTCSQTCSGDNCEMECTDEVKVCQQSCQANSTCKISCKLPTKCELSCDEAKGANCSGIPEVPSVKNACDEITGNCSKTCTGDCKGKTLSCGMNIFKECHLSCKGCKMVCDASVAKCTQTCIGDEKCTSECKAKNCIKMGKFETHSGAVVSRVNHLMFVLFACILLLV